MLSSHFHYIFKRLLLFLLKRFSQECKLHKESVFIVFYHLDVSKRREDLSDLLNIRVSFCLYPDSLFLLVLDVLKLLLSFFNTAKVVEARNLNVHHNSVLEPLKVLERKLLILNRSEVLLG